MDINSAITLLLIETNNASLRRIVLGGTHSNRTAAMRLHRRGYFNSNDSVDFSHLGNYIGRNTNLQMLEVRVPRDGQESWESGLNANNDGLFIGLSSNSSICALGIEGPLGALWAKIMHSYRGNANLEYLSIGYCNLRIPTHGLLIFATNALIDTLISCKNLEMIRLHHCTLTDWQLSRVVHSTTSLHMLVELNLASCEIGNAACEILATLLEDPNCNIRTLFLINNMIDEHGAAAIVGTLSRNNKLKVLDLRRNPIHTTSTYNAVENAICNTTNIHSLHTSNHTFSMLRYDSIMLRIGVAWCEPPVSIQFLNEKENKHHVAIIKILLFYPPVDMRLFFEWGMDEDDAPTLKALPYVVDWFERAKAAISNDDGTWHHYDTAWHNIDAKVLSAIYLFAKEMPLLFTAPLISIGKIARKRKRDNTTML